MEHQPFLILHLVQSNGNGMQIARNDPHRQPLLAKMLVMISCPAPTIESPHSANSFGGGSERYTGMDCIVLFLN
jgi:hypothetical protein